MKIRSPFLLIFACAAPASAQSARDVGSIARDLTPMPPSGTARGNEIMPPPAPSASEATAQFNSVMIGGVSVEGVEVIPREAFAPVMSAYLGKQASARDLQVLAKAVASVARDRGYVFATAFVPAQTIDAGIVKVRIDAGDIAAVRITGSASVRLRRTLDLIVGPAVRREVLERQLLLAGDIPGIEVVMTKLVHEDVGNVLVVEVKESRGSGSADIDNYGSRELGPVRARLRYDFVGLIDDDLLSVQGVATPVNPRELAYFSARYAATLGTGGAQVAVTGAVGRAEPSKSGFKSTSTYVSVSANAPLQRANGASIWVNAELGALRVNGADNGLSDQRDSMVVATGWLYATTRTGRGRLSGAVGLARGLALHGTTTSGDPRASRPDADGTFTKGFFWADWTEPLGHGFTVKLAANGQIADRPLLAAQEIGLGGPAFGRAFDFSERFGDSGFMGSGELRFKQARPAPWIDWIEPFVFLDAGRVWNLNGGYGGGDLQSAGGGLRAALGNLQIAFEAAFPITSPRSATGNKAPRLNVSVGRRF
jgi:hemolysin activation/secretion protein